MTKLEVIREHRKQYTELEMHIQAMTGLERAVAQHVILPWIKGTNWLGGLSDSACNKAYNRVIVWWHGKYTWDDVDEEATRQMAILVHQFIGGK